MSTIKTKEDAIRFVSEDNGIDMESGRTRYNLLLHENEALASDRDVIIAALRINPVNIMMVPDEYKDDKEAALIVVSRVGAFLRYFSESIRSDLDVVRTALYHLSDGALTHILITPELIDDKEIRELAIKYYAAEFQYLPNLMKSNKEQVLYYINEINPYIYQYLPKTVKDDIDVIKAVLTREFYTIRFVTNKNKSLLDKEFYILALHSATNKEYDFTEEFKKYIPKPYLKDEDFVSRIVEAHPNILEAADKKFKDNKEIILKLVKHNGDGLEFASKRLKEDKEVVLTAVQEDGFALRYVLNEELRRDKDILRAALNECGAYLRFIPDEYKDDEELVSVAVKCDAWAIENASDRLQHDKDFVLSLMKVKPDMYEYIPDELQEDEEIKSLVVEKEKHEVTLEGLISDWVADPLAPFHLVGYNYLYENKDEILKLHPELEKYLPF